MSHPLGGHGLEYQLSEWRRRDSYNDLKRYNHWLLTFWGAGVELGTACHMADALLVATRRRP